MPRIKCGSTNCIHNECHYCQSKEVEFTELNIFAYEDGLSQFSKCLTYEKRTDFVTFMEERELG